KTRATVRRFHTKYAIVSLSLLTHASMRRDRRAFGRMLAEVRRQAAHPKARLRRRKYSTREPRVFWTLRRMQSWILLLAWAIVLTTLHGAEAYSARLRVQPGRAVAGEWFLEQPQLEVLGSDGATIATSFQGYATAQIQIDPSDVGSSTLWCNNSSSPA
ncbi:unnamed protein product, partial [Phaeothamnion confervicola]